MPQPARTKESYGTCSVDHFSPPPSLVWPPAINVVIGFEEALKLNLALDEALRDINKLHRGTKEGKRAAVNLCVYTKRTSPQITVNSANLKE